MAKRGMELPRVYEPDENMTHYLSYPMQDAVTLCNMTDWIHQTLGEDTRKPVTCNMCLSIVDYVKGRISHG